ncbi:MAG: class I SAM-dependent methyltransferase, partial [Patescibacteria group bacterium]|nr:class I SAM-dependent methyltransferase [Patescibacteria group bacterium]
MARMDPKGYEYVWKKEEDLEEINRRIHDGVPLDKLLDRAKDYCGIMFDNLFPYASPAREAKVMEFGSGVGWIMEAMLIKFPSIKITGLDISKNMIAKAQERWQDDRAKFVSYDGLSVPFPDNYFDVIYSVAAIQHIEKHAAFLLLKQLHRVLAPGGHAVLHFLSMRHLRHSVTPYDIECLNHVNNNIKEHWHHYYTFDELYTIFCDVIGVEDFDIRYVNQSYFVHFSKGTGNKLRRNEVAKIIPFEMEIVENKPLDTRIEQLSRDIEEKTLQEESLSKDPLGALLTVYSKRHDLKNIYPGVSLGDYQPLIQWAADVATGKKEDSYAEILMPHSQWYLEQVVKYNENIDLGSRIEQLSRDIEEKTLQEE